MSNINIDLIEKCFTNGIDDAQKNNLIETVNLTFDALNSGEIRVAEFKNNEWVVNEWIKKAILLSFKLKSNKIIDTGYTKFFDKLSSRFLSTTQEHLIDKNIRVVPQAIAREGTFIGENVVLMPSCAQIGKNVHLSGGVGIGGVLEPLQANPTIIEDNCFIGARSEIVEGVVVKKNSVISMGVFIGKSTKIYDRDTDTVSYGVVPEGSVVVSGSLPSKDGKYNLYCVVIVKRVDEKTRSKVGINELLREA